MKSISQFFSDPNFRAIVSPNGRYVVKHSSEENYEGYNEIFLLYDKGEKIRDIIGENCLFIGNEYLLKFPFWGYSEDCQDLILINLSNNSLIKVNYPTDIEPYLISRTAIYSKSEEKVYYFSNVKSALKDYTKSLYCLDVSQLINNNMVRILETTLNFIPNNTFLDIFKDYIYCCDEKNNVIQLKVPIKDASEIIIYPNTNSDTYEIPNVDNLLILDVHTISSKMNKDGSFTTKRSEIGELLYRFKYRNEFNLVDGISQYVSERILNYFGPYSIDVILPMPPSNEDRKYQPVEQIAKFVSKRIKIPVDFSYLKKSRQTTEIKTLSNSKERQNCLENVFKLTDNRYSGKNVLIIDDLIRSGTTLGAAAKTLKKAGGVKGILGVVITKTRTKR